jgi:hypothetical protein
MQYSSSQGGSKVAACHHQGLAVLQQALHVAFQHWTIVYSSLSASCYPLKPKHQSAITAV